MDSSDHALVSSLRHSLLSLAGHAHRSDFDAESAAAVASASHSLARGISLLGSGLLSVDARTALQTVAAVVTDLIESDAATRYFHWRLVPPQHLVGCAVHFALSAFSSTSSPSTAPLHVAAGLLERASGGTLSDHDAVRLLYLSRREALSGDHNLSLRLELSSVSLLDVASVEAAVDVLWYRGLFSLVRERLLVDVDSARVDSPSATAGDGAQIAESFAELHWRTGAVSRDDVPSLFALALPLSASLAPAHRLIALRLVLRFVETADRNAAETHFDAVLHAARESLTLLHPHVIPVAFDLLLHAVRKACEPRESLAHSDTRREAAAALAFDVLARAAEEEPRMDDNDNLRAASALGLSVAVHIAGPVALLRRSCLFVALFATLFVRAASCDEEDVDVLASAFADAVEIAWPRLGASRVAIVRACVTGVMDTRGADANKGTRVESAACRCLTALLQCDGARRTKMLLEGLFEQARTYSSLAPAASLLSKVLAYAQDGEVKRGKWDDRQDERYGSVVHRFFADGMETPQGRTN